MNQILMNFSILLLFTSNFMLGESQETALLFNYKTNAIMNSKNLNDEDTCESCATACPARTSFTSENQFNEVKSIGKNSLIVQEDFPQLESMKNIKLEICENPFQASVIYNKYAEQIEFGYELYYGDFPPLEKYSEKLNYKSYGPVTDVLPKSFNEGVITLTRSLSHSFSFSSDDPELNLEDRNMNFLWISLLSLRYNGEVRSPKQLSYETDVYSSKTCENYDLGKEIYEDIDMKKIYDQENIDKVFEGKVTPILDEKNQGRNLVPEMVTKSGRACITSWNLIPEKYFNFYSTKFFSCSYLTTVPVWCYFANELLKRLDQYIDVLTQIVPEKKLHVTSGTLETLTLLPRKKDDEPEILAKIKKPEEVYLAKAKKGKKIPIPAIIYKLIEFKSSECPENHRECWYSIIIEIHNAPYILKSKSKDSICKKSKCIAWGWNLLDGRINNSSTDFPISCCEVTPQIEKKLKLPAQDERNARYEMNLISYKFPYINEKNELHIETLRDKVNQGLMELLKLEPGIDQETEVSKKENENETASSSA